jgi:PilZ domain
MEKLISEKRVYSRRDCSLPIHYREFGKAVSTAEKSITMNISGGGVAFKSNVFMPLARRLIGEILLPEERESVKVILKAIWIKKVLSTGQYDIGGQFLEIAKKDRVRIIKHEK